MANQWQLYSELWKNDADDRADDSRELSNKFEAGIQYLNEYLLFFFGKTRFAFVIKINKIS